MIQKSIKVFLKGMYMALLEGGGFLKHGWLKYGFLQIFNTIIFGVAYIFFRMKLPYNQAYNQSQQAAGVLFKRLVPQIALKYQGRQLKIQPEYSDLNCLSVLKEVFVDDIYDIENQICSGMTVLDIGANIGFYSLAAACLLDQGKVIAFEPLPENYKILTSNIKKNNFKNITPESCALYKESGAMNLLTGSSMGPTLQINSKQIGDSILVQVLTLDEFCFRHGLSSVDVIKIDTEGVELEILQGAENILKNSRSLRLAIASYHYDNEVEKISMFLKERNFEVKVTDKKIIHAIKH